jgi:twitching motility protein PilJ
MEQTTTEVVSGAKRAQDAGVALEEIESVSTSLAELIQNISNAARQQAASAGHVSNTMGVIQEITSQTANGTEATAKSVGALARWRTRCACPWNSSSCPAIRSLVERQRMDGRCTPR